MVSSDETSLAFCSSGDFITAAAYQDLGRQNKEPSLRPKIHLGSFLSGPPGRRRCLSHSGNIYLKSIWDVIVWKVKWGQKEKKIELFTGNWLILSYSSSTAGSGKSLTYEQPAFKAWLCLTGVLIRQETIRFAGGPSMGTIGGGNGMQGKRKWQMIQLQHGG